jgi:hypothetical protein
MRFWATPHPIADLYPNNGAAGRHMERVLYICYLNTIDNEILILARLPIAKDIVWLII